MPVWNGCDEAAVFPVDLVLLLLYVFHDGWFVPVPLSLAGFVFLNYCVEASTCFHDVDFAAFAWYLVDSWLRVLVFPVFVCVEWWVKFCCWNDVWLLCWPSSGYVGVCVISCPCKGWWLLWALGVVGWRLGGRTLIFSLGYPLMVVSVDLMCWSSCWMCCLSLRSCARLMSVLETDCRLDVLNDRLLPWWCGRPGMGVILGLLFPWWIWCWSADCWGVERSCPVAAYCVAKLWRCRQRIWARVWIDVLPVVVLMFRSLPWICWLRWVIPWLLLEVAPSPSLSEDTMESYRNHI